MGGSLVSEMRRLPVLSSQHAHDPMPLMPDPAHALSELLPHTHEQRQVLAGRAVKEGAS